MNTVSKLLAATAMVAFASQAHAASTLESFAFGNPSISFNTSSGTNLGNASSLPFSPDVAISSITTDVSSTLAVSDVLTVLPDPLSTSATSLGFSVGDISFSSTAGGVAYTPLTNTYSFNFTGEWTSDDINYYNGTFTGSYTQSDTTTAAATLSGNFYGFSTPAPAVPEPVSMSILGLGIAGLAASRRRRA